ncbi:hypothetical protein G9A89_013808 [Geosiphon pyriformis]|nr:hypothetical protein G9A89_013808 [Geosiphon pyriformis]
MNSLYYPVSTSADNSGTGLAGLGTWSSGKKKAHVDSVYFYGPLFKKPKMSVASEVVNLSAGSLSLEDIGSAGSKVGSVSSSISSFLDVKNIENMVAEETSYTESGENNNIDEVIPKKTHTQTYVLDNLPKKLLFEQVSDDNIKLVFPAFKFVGSNQLPSAKLCVLEKQCFEPVKLFALNVELSAVSGKTNNNKLILKTRELAIHEKIVVNVDVRQVNKHLDWVIVVKEILVDLSKLAVKFVFSKFEKIVSIKMQLIGLWQKALVEFESSEIADLVTARWSVFMKKDSVYVAKAVNDKQLCAIVYFVDKASKSAAIGSTLVFKSVNLHWAGLSLACCAHCKQFGHISTECLLAENSGAHAKQMAPIVCPVFFGRKTWAQVVSSSFFHVVLSNLFGTGLFLSAKPVSLVSNSLGNSCLVNRLALLKCFLELLTDQVLVIMKKLSFVELVPLAFKPCVSFLVVLTPIMSNLNSEMALDDTLASSSLSLSVVVADSVADLSLSSSKVLTTKMSRLESKIVALEVSVESVLERLDCINFVWKIVMCNIRDINVSAKQKDIICWHRNSENLNKFDRIRVFLSGLDKSFLGAGVTIIMNILLAHHVYKIFEVPGQLLLVKLLFKNKLSVSILGLYVGTSLAVHFFQTNIINSMIAKTVNESLFVVLDSNFNKDGSRRCASFKKCLDLGLINSLVNSWGMAKTIDFLFIFSNLVNAVVNCGMFNVDEFFDINHQAIFVSNNFKGAILANATMFSNEFVTSARFSNLDVMWDTVCKIMGFNNVFTKKSLWFHKLELLVSRIVRASCEKCIVNFDSLMRCWVFLDNVKTSVIQDIVSSGAGSDCIHSALFSVRKSYCTAKFAESLRAKETNIRLAINRRMESFDVNKGHTIRSVLECLFCKMSFNHLVVNNKLILKPDLVKSKVDVIIKGWTKKHKVYVFDKAFSGVMNSIRFNKLVGVVSDLPDNKAVGLLVVKNALKKDQKLWLVLQDMHKAYDLVGWEHLEKGMIHILLNCDLSLSSSLANFFQFRDEVFMSVVLDELKLDPRGFVLEWFKLSVVFLNNVTLFPTQLLAVYDSGSLNILGSNNFVSICDYLSQINTSVLSVYMDGSLKNLSTASCKASAAVFFEDIDLGLGVGILGLMFSTLAELQAIVLALECVLSSSSICLFSDSQSVLDAYRSELGLVCPDFHNQCWVEC